MAILPLTNFTNFVTATPGSQDYLVGYTGVGTPHEYKTTFSTVTGILANSATVSSTNLTHGGPSWDYYFNLDVGSPNGSLTTPTVKFGTSPYQALLSLNNNQFAFNTNTNSTKFVITTQGNVGVGNTTPSYPLTVSGATYLSGNSNYATSLTSNGGFDLAIATNTADKILYVGGNNNGYSLQATTSSTSLSSALLLNPLGGFVGINTTTPNANLTVSGNISASGNINALGTITANSGLSAIGYVSAKTNSQNAGFIVQTASGSTTAALTGSNTSNDNGTLALSNNGTTSVYIQASGVSYFNNGNVGIGTTSPTYGFDVQQNSPSTPATIRVYNSDSSGTSIGRLIVQNATGTNAVVQASGTNIVIGGQTGNSSPLKFINNGNTAITVLSGGNVGIGKTNPTVPLDVSGQINATSIFATDSLTVSGNIYGGIIYSNGVPITPGGGGGGSGGVILSSGGFVQGTITSGISDTKQISAASPSNCLLYTSPSPRD